MSILNLKIPRPIFAALVRIPSLVVLILLTLVVFGDQGLLSRNHSKQILSQIIAERNHIDSQNNDLELELLQLRHLKNSIELTGASTTFDIGKDVTIYRFHSFEDGD